MSDIDQQRTTPRGPLAGLRVVELAGLGPAPFCAMLLADLGADVVRVGRPGGGGGHAQNDVVNRGKRAVEVDLKDPAGIAALLRAVETADVLVEGFRPGVAERLGTDLVLFPGHHAGFLGGEFGMHGDPDGFARALRDALT